MNASVASCLMPATPEIAFGDQVAGMRRGGAWEMAGPVMCEGCLVLVMATDLESQARQFFEVVEHEQFELQGDMSTATFGVQIALGQLVAKLCEIDGRSARSEVLHALSDLGLGSVASVSMTMFPDGKYVGQTMALDYDGSADGLISLVLPTRRTRPNLLRYLPPSARTWSVWPIDGAGVAEFYPRVFELLGDKLPIAREQFETQFTAYTKLRLVEDVLSLIGDEYMRIDDPAAVLEYDEDMPESVENAQDQFGNSCFVLQVRDGKTLGRNLDTAIRSRGLHVGRKSEDYATTKIYRMNLLGMLPIEYAVTDSLLLLGIGESEGTRQNLRGVLDAVSAGQAEPTEFPPEVMQRLEGLPEDWSGIDVASITEVLDGLIASLAEWEAWLVEEDIDPEDIDEGMWWAALELAKALRPELARESAATVVTVDYFGKDRYLSRSRW